LDDITNEPKTIIYGRYLTITHITQNNSIKVSKGKHTEKNHKETIYLSKKLAEKKECKNIIQILKKLANEPIEQPDGSYISLKEYTYDFNIR
jgi:hypothetical protein